MLLENVIQFILKFSGFISNFTNENLKETETLLTEAFDPPLKTFNNGTESS